MRLAGAIAVFVLAAVVAFGAFELINDGHPIAGGSVGALLGAAVWAIGRR